MKCETGDDESSGGLHLGRAMTTTYTEGVGTPPWLVDLTTELLAPTFLDEALTAALLDKVMRAAPSEDTDEPGASRITADITFTTKPVPQDADRTTDTIVSSHEVCHMVSLTVFGHEIFSWGTCHSEATFASGASTRLETRVPSRTESVHAVDMPPWLADLTKQLLAPTFFEEALTAALLDKVMRAAPSEDTDEPGASRITADITFTTKPVPKDAGRTTPTDTLHIVCNSHTLSVFGHSIYSFDICTTKDSSGSSPVIHLEARHATHATG